MNTATLTTRARSGTTSAGCSSAINRGNAALGIHAYNGGLFADDPVLDRLKVSDEVCAYFRELGDYDYRPAHQAAAYAPAAGNSSLIDVDILGHIFEQSITDLEKLRNELDGRLPSPSGRGAGGEGSVDEPAPHARAAARRKARSTPRPSSPATSSNRRWAGCCGTVSSNSGNRTRRRPRARPAPPWPIRPSTPWTS